MVGGSDNDHIDVLVVDEPTPVLVEVGHFLALNLFGVCSPAVQYALVDIAKGDTIKLGVAEERL